MPVRFARVHTPKLHLRGGGGGGRRGTVQNSRFEGLPIIEGGEGGGTAEPGSYIRLWGYFDAKGTTGLGRTSGLLF